MYIYVVSETKIFVYSSVHEETGIEKDHTQRGTGSKGNVSLKNLFIRYKWQKGQWVENKRGIRCHENRRVMNNDWISKGQK